MKSCNNNIVQYIALWDGIFRFGDKHKMHVPILSRVIFSAIAISGPGRSPEMRLPAMCSVSRVGSDHRQAGREDGHRILFHFFILVNQD